MAEQPRERTSKSAQHYRRRQLYSARTGEGCDASEPPMPTDIHLMYPLCASIRQFRHPSPNRLVGDFNHVLPGNRLMLPRGSQLGCIRGCPCDNINDCEDFVSGISGVVAASVSLLWVRWLYGKTLLLLGQREGGISACSHFPGEERLGMMMSSGRGPMMDSRPSSFVCIVLARTYWGRMSFTLACV